MAFNLTDFGLIGGEAQGGKSFTQYSYISTDSTETLLTDGYFNSLGGKVRVNDVIYVQNKSGDGLAADYFIRVTLIPLNGSLLVEQVGMPAEIGELDFLDLKTDVTPEPDYKEGRLNWNDGEHTTDIHTGIGDSKIQIGHEMVVLFYNGTGATIANGSVLHPAGGAMEEGVVVPTVELADASDFEKCQGTLFVATTEVPDSSIGLGTRFGKVRGIDTSALGAGSQVFLSDTTPGALVNTQPQFPSFVISLGGTLNADAVDGEVFINQTSGVSDTFDNGWDGAIRETFDFRTTSDGTTITGTLTNPNADHDTLNLIFSSGIYSFDASAATIALTPGSTTVPQMNYVYIPESTKVLTVSTSGFPDTEHCKIASLTLLDAATTQTSGALRNQNINDHVKSDDDNGHITHIAERVRQLNAEWDTGIASTLTGTTSDLYIQTTSGTVWQMHKQTFPAQDMSSGDDIHVVNDPTTPYRVTSNLNDITEYSDGSTWNNEWSNIVVWGVCNKTGEVSHLMCNLPSEGYNSEENAVFDGSNFSNYTIPKEFKGVGFLIGRFTIRISGSTFTYNSGTGYLDLRGFTPNNTAGGGTGSSGITEFTQLADVPSSYTGQAGKVPTVNAGETGLEFIANETASLSEGYIKGLLISNNTTDPTTVIDIADGKCRTADDTADIIAEGALKQADSKELANGTGGLWEAGDGGAGLPSGVSLTASTTYHYFALLRDDGTGRVDFGFDTDIDATNLLADAQIVTLGYEKPRRVGSVVTDASSDIIEFTSYEDASGACEIVYTDKIADEIGKLVGTTETSVEFTIPSGINADPKVAITKSPSVMGVVYYASMSVGTPVTPTSTYYDLMWQAPSGITRELGVNGYIKVNSSNEVNLISNASSAAIDFFTYGFKDQRII